MHFLSFIFTLAICTILNDYTQFNIKILLYKLTILLAFLLRVSLYHFIVSVTK